KGKRTSSSSPGPMRYGAGADAFVRRISAGGGATIGVTLVAHPATASAITPRTGATFLFPYRTPNISICLLRGGAAIRPLPRAAARVLQGFDPFCPIADSQVQ